MKTNPNPNHKTQTPSLTQNLTLKVNPKAYNIIIDEFSVDFSGFG